MLKLIQLKVRKKKNVTSPKEIFSNLDELCHRSRRSKKSSLAVAVYNHYKRLSDQPRPQDNDRFCRYFKK